MHFENSHIHIAENVLLMCAGSPAPPALPQVVVNTNANQLKMNMWPVIFIIIVASTAVRLFRSFLKQDPISKIPLVGDDIKDEGTRRIMFAKGAKHVYQAGYRKFKNGLFRVSSPRGTNAESPWGEAEGLMLITK